MANVDQTAEWKADQAAGAISGDEASPDLIRHRNGAFSSTCASLHDCS
jgi:hypothetical protein